MGGVEALDLHRLAHQTGRSNEGACLDAVAHHLMRDGVQLGHALDLDDRRAGSLDRGAHLVEQVGEVHDLGLAGGIVDDGRALGTHRGHHEVLGGTHAGKVKRDCGARQPMRRSGVDVAVVEVEIDAEGLQAQDVHVDLARADVAAARHGHSGLSEAPQQRPEHGGRGAHLRNQLVWRDPALHRRSVDAQRVHVDDIDLGA